MANFKEELEHIQEQLDTAEASEQATKATDPERALALLLEGNKRYLSQTAERPNTTVERRLAIVKEQRPFATILGCSDSRVPPEILFDYGLGDLFIVRVAGNVIDESVLGSLEYAAGALEVPLLLVLGHEACGAVKAALNVVRHNEEVAGHVGKLVEMIKPAVARVVGEPGDMLQNAIKSNVRMVVETLPSASPMLAELVEEGKLKIAGAYYGLESGKIEILGEPQAER